MSNYDSHAWNEFRAAGWVDEGNNFKDEMQKAICHHVLALLAVFENEGHSGTSAPYTINLFKKLAMFEPLAPLTGEDWEWTEICDERTNGVSVFQNKRFSSVFKQSDRFDGKPYWLDGRVFWEWYKDEDGNMSKIYFTGRDSPVTIEFPWVKPEHPEYVFSPTEEFPLEEYTND
jgi:hypothetical protein